MSRGAQRVLKWTTQASVMAALALGLIAFVGINKEVVVTVDGRTTSVTTVAGTVGAALHSADIEISARDKVQPALSATVHDGSRISVKTAKKVQVELDGAERTVRTTGSTVADLVDELDVPAEAKVSEPATTVLASSGDYVEISIPKQVHVVVDGQIRSETTTAATVGGLLDSIGIRLDQDDRVSVSDRTPVIEDMAVKITRVDNAGKDTVEEGIAFDTVAEEDPDLPEGKRKVVRTGAPGTLTKTYTVTRLDGEEVGRSLVSKEVTAEPVARKIAIGTKERPEPEPEAEPEPAVKTASNSGGDSSGGGDSADTAGGGAAGATAAAVSGVWQSLAQCESGGNWSINTGNGYYGGLQFSQSSWLGAGGGKYAPLPHLASPSEQIATAKVLKQGGGWGHWPSCASQLGLL
ncbi:resuscitation-promoting factor [Arthrobacter castelli]|uniref:resuscitation-promoting factor n=1 Tax=Arthrobacter castelli TaxID=271431 RepID=UPI0003F8B23F|nr:resuscitation-promoting factor [Arthrobacter castelli]